MTFQFKGESVEFIAKTKGEDIPLSVEQTEFLLNSMKGTDVSIHFFLGVLHIIGRVRTKKSTKTNIYENLPLRAKFKKSNEYLI